MYVYDFLSSDHYKDESMSSIISIILADFMRATSYSIKKTSQCNTCFSAMQCIIPCNLF